MKTKYFFLAAAAALFAACSSDDGIAEQQQAVQQAEQVPVAFSGYVNRTITRAGVYEDIDAAALKTPGFGVFAYYTDNNDYDNFSIPNFMYNQQVTGSGDSEPYTWTYAPIKYWPNEYGSNAVSEDYDRVTFFAYAPFVAVNPTTGKVITEGSDPTPSDHATDPTGIVGLSRNSAAGDPLVKYIASFDPAKRVDLLWGVVGASEYNSWSTKEGATPPTNQTTLKSGFPWMNVKRAAGVDQKLKFTFNHALAKLNVQIDADVDDNAHNETTDVAASNKIFVRSITFTGLATKGALNLNNDETANVAKWYSFSGLSDLETGEEVTIYDGRKDGKEGTATASTEKVTGLNTDLIEDDVWVTVNVDGKGVEKTAKNLFSSATATDAIYVIPTNERVDVTIVYEVEAEDKNLPTLLADGATHGSRVKNTITKTNVFAKLENGKFYTLKLHLGMNSVKFDAAVTGWAAETPVDSWHPAN